MSNDLIAAAAAAGAIDALDFAKLVDPAVIKFDADGKPSNLAEIVAAMQAAKPYLFRKSAVAMEPGEHAPARRDILRSAGKAQRAEDDRRATERAVTNLKRRSH